MSLVGHILSSVLQIYSFILLARILLSYIPNVDRSNPIVQALYNVTEPVLQPIRERIPPMQGFDISPIIVFAGIFVLRLIIGSIFQL